MEQLGSHWTDSYEIWYLSTFRNCVDKIQVSLKSEINNLYFTLRPVHICDNISFSSSSNDKFFRVVEKIEIHFTFSNFFKKNGEVCGRMCKNIVEPGMPAIKITAHAHYMLNM